MKHNLELINEMLQDPFAIAFFIIVGLILIYVLGTIFWVSLKSYQIDIESKIREKKYVNKNSLMFMLCDRFIFINSRNNEMKYHAIFMAKLKELQKNNL